MPRAPEGLDLSGDGAAAAELAERVAQMEESLSVAERERLRLQQVSLMPSPPPPTHIEPGSSYARSHRLNLPPPPPHLGGKRFTPISGIDNHWLLQKNTPFPKFSWEIYPRQMPKIPPLLRKWEHACGPIVCSSVCVCGGGGGRVL